MKRHGPQLVGPVIIGKDTLQLLLAAFQCMSLLESVVNQLLHHIWMEGVGDVEQVLAITMPTFGVLVRKELGHPF